MVKKLFVYFSLLIVSALLSGQDPVYSTNKVKTWANWYWPDRDIEKPELERQLVEIKSKGFGGVHIFPGNINIASNSLTIPDYSIPWYENLNYVIQFAKKIELEIDISINKYSVYENDSLSNLYGFQVLKTHVLDSVIPGYSIKESIDSLLYITDTIIAVYAISETLKEHIDITWLIDKTNYTEYFTESSGWKIYLLTSTFSGQKKKLNSPLKQGFLYDYFDSLSNIWHLQTHYSKITDKGFHGFVPENVDNKTGKILWSHKFIEEFQKRRNYNLRDYLYLFTDGYESEIKSRVIGDYYETISELIEDSYLKTINKRGKDNDLILRNNVFGLPGNILDLYASTDIPFVKQVGRNIIDVPNILYYSEQDHKKYGQPNQYINKFAVSSANINGKSIISSSVGHGITEHFTLNAAHLKAEIDLLFTSGINQVFLDGISYSPAKVEWPGWLNNKSGNIGFSSALWNDMDDFNNYISTCQEILQNSNSDNDILIYFPIYDYWNQTSSADQIPCFSYNDFNSWFIQSPTGHLSLELEMGGYLFDYISDKQILNLEYRNKSIVSGDAKYKLIIFPKCSYIPLNTLNKILELAHDGANIVFTGGLPKDVPGFFKYEINRLKLLDVKYALFVNPNISVVQELSEAYILKKIRKEELAYYNLSYIRKKADNKTYYFIVNNQSEQIDGYIMLSEKMDKYELFNPVTQRRGWIEKDVSGKIRLQLKPGESMFIFCNLSPNSMPWIYDNSEMLPVTIHAKWLISFPDGMPKIKDTIAVNNFNQLDKILHDDMKYYSGSIKYQCGFELPPELKSNEMHVLNLGNYTGSAEVILNGTNLGKRLSFPYEYIISPKLLLKKENVLVINLNTDYINRLLLMEKKQSNWSNYYENEFLGINDGLFDSESIKLQPVGLRDNITLTPLRP